MSSSVVVVCSHGHRFPVNLKKHTYRRYVFCPECRERVNVRKRIFGPNPDWEEKKEERRQDRFEAREMRRKPSKAPATALPRIDIRRLMMTSLVMSRLIRKREEEVKESERKGDD